jgi:hypothetical protein
MENKICSYCKTEITSIICSCCKTEITYKSIKADELYVICLESYNYHKGLEEYDYNFYVKCRNCNSLIKITIDEAKEILKNCGYECEYYRWHYQLNVFETAWKDDYPNNFKQVDYHSGFNPNDIFKIKVEININDDIVSNLDNARKYLNNVQSILNDNKADKKCQNAYRQLSDILHDFNKLEIAIKEIKNNIQ